MQFMYRHDAFIRLVDQYDSASPCTFQHTLPIVDEEVEERSIDQGVALEAEAGVVDSAAERGGSDHREGGVRTVDDYWITLLMILERKRPCTVRLDDRHLVSCDKYVQDLLTWRDQLLRVHQGPLSIQDALCGDRFVGECIRLLHEHMVHVVVEMSRPLYLRGGGQQDAPKKLVTKFVLQLQILVLSCP